MFHRTLSRNTPALATITSSRPNSLTARSTHGLRRVSLADCDDLADGTSAGVGDQRDRLGRGGIVDVVDDHSRARICQSDGVGSAEATSASGDDGDLAVNVRRAHAQEPNQAFAATVGPLRAFDLDSRRELRLEAALISVTSAIFAVPRQRPPTGSGAGKRTLSNP